MKKNCKLSIIEKKNVSVEKHAKYVRMRRIRVMDYKLQQERMDDIKWYDSIVAGEDRCGSYDFCVKCKKESKYPCARAKLRYEHGLVRIATIVCHRELND